LLVIGAYRMGFNIAPAPAGATVRIWIDYELPSKGAERWLGRLLGARYARWCIERMLGDAASKFGEPATLAAA
jgi:hypothetical protein